MSLLNIEVLCEDTGTVINLPLTQEQYERAIRDSRYLQQLVNEFRSSQFENLPENSGETVQTITDPEQEANDENSSFIWTNSAVLLLLSLYEEHCQDFNVKRHKKVWEEIAQLMQATNTALNVTGLQCQTKMNGLKRTYKKILDHNNTSGNNRASWPFFERMHEIFSGARWVQPVALASERGPFPSTSQEDTGPFPSTSQNTENSENVPPSKKKRVDRFLDNYLTVIKDQQEKRRQERQDRFNKNMEMREKHHKEKMKLLQDFLNKM